MSNQCEQGGTLPKDVAEQLSSRLVKIPQIVREALSLPFDPRDIKEGPSRADGFKPRILDAMALIHRLNDTFDWKFTIRSVAIDHTARVAIAVVSIGWKYPVTLAGSTTDLIETHRDGVGVVRLTATQQGYVDVDFDIKAAVTDGIKNAAKHIGIGLELWAKPVVYTTAAAAAVAQPVAEHVPAQQFQIAAICNYFEVTCQVPRATWLQSIGLSDFTQIDYHLAADILSGKHAYVQWLQTQTGKPIAVMTTSQAR